MPPMNAMQASSTTPSQSRNHPRFSAFICGLVLFLAFDSAHADDKLKSIELKDHHLVISHPAQWKPVASGAPGGVFAVELDEPMLPNGKGPAVVVFMVVPPDAAAGVDSAKALSEKWLASLGKNFKDLKTVTTEDVTIDGAPALALTVIGSRGGNNFVFFQRYVVRNGKSFILQMMAVDLYSDDVKPQLDKVAESWKWTDKPAGETAPPKPIPTPKPATEPSDEPNGTFAQPPIPFEDKLRGVTLSYPPALSRSNEKIANVVLKLTGRGHTEVLVTALPQRKEPGKSLEVGQLFKRQADIFKKQFSNTVDLETGDATLDTEPARFVVFSGTLLRNRTPTNAMLLVAVKGTTLYTVSLKCDPADFDAVRKDVDSIIESIRLTR